MHLANLNSPTEIGAKKHFASFFLPSFTSSDSGRMDSSRRPTAPGLTASAPFLVTLNHSIDAAVLQQGVLDINVVRGCRATTTGTTTRTAPIPSRGRRRWGPRRCWRPMGRGTTSSTRRTWGCGRPTTAASWSAGSRGGDGCARACRGCPRRVGRLHSFDSRWREPAVAAARTAAFRPRLGMRSVAASGSGAHARQQRAFVDDGVVKLPVLADFVAGGQVVHGHRVDVFAKKTNTAIAKYEISPARVHAVVGLGVGAHSGVVHVRRRFDVEAVLKRGAQHIGRASRVATGLLPVEQGRAGDALPRWRCWPKSWTARRRRSCSTGRR